MVKVGIVGGTGYTGVELLRLLASHEQVEVVAITSRAECGRRVDELFPNLRGYYELAFSEPEVQQLAACDVVFFATPHNVAMNLVPELLGRAPGLWICRRITACGMLRSGHSGMASRMPARNYWPRRYTACRKSIGRR